MFTRKPALTSLFIDANSRWRTSCRDGPHSCDRSKLFGGSDSAPSVSFSASPSV